MTKTQLYHSMKSEHLLDIIENGGWKKLSTHFLYSSFSDKEKYGKCVNGLCLSRDSNFVKNWNGDIVVVFDKGEIQKKYNDYELAQMEMEMKIIVFVLNNNIVKE